MSIALRVSLVLALLLANPARGQSTWFVDAAATPPGDGSAATPFASLSLAIASANVATGDTLSIAPGSYVENVALGSKGLRLVGVLGPEVTEVRAAANGPVIDTPFFGPLVEIEGLTLAGAPNLATSGVAGGNVVVRRCILRDHRSGGLNVFADGAGAFSKFDLWMESCTVVRNAIGVELHVFGGAAYVSNSVLVENVGADLSEQLDMTVSAASWSLWRTGATHAELGTGNLDLDPMLWDLPTNDFALRPGSPCIDSGDPNAPPDPDGSRVDRGAIEFDASYAPGPEVYCTAKVNSLGCTPAIGASGSASATTPASFHIACTNELNQRAGLLFYGYTPQALAFQGGWLCVRAPTARTPLQNSGGSVNGSDCSGAYAYDFNARIQSGVDPALTPGAVVYAQYWSRDPGASFATNRSGALRFGVAP